MIISGSYFRDFIYSIEFILSSNKFSLSRFFELLKYGNGRYITRNAIYGERLAQLRETFISLTNFPPEIRNALCFICLPENYQISFLPNKNIKITKYLFILFLNETLKIKISSKNINFELSSYLRIFEYLILARIKYEAKRTTFWQERDMAVEGSGISSADESEQKGRGAARKRYVLQIERTIRRSQIQLF